MDLVVRQPDGSERTTLVIDDKTILEKGLMGDDVITCPVIVSDITGPNSIQVDDYIVFQSNNYYLNRPSEYQKLKNNKYKYTFFFEGEIYKLLDKMFIHPTTGLGDFYLVENAEGIIDLLLQNMNASQSTGWTKGTIWSTDRKNVYFESDTCRNVLNKIANEFSLEFHLVGKQINFVEKFETPTILSFQVGRTTGLYELSRLNVDKNNTITRAYLYGSTKNITADYRNNVKRLVYESAEGNRYIENTTHFNRIVERSVIFDEVYPRFNGTIESVEAVDGITKKFICSAIDFDVEAQMMTATPPKVVFLTGDLSGKEFEFAWDNTTKAVTLVSLSDDGDVTYPNESFYPKVGDEFTFVDIIMPDSYIDAAETELYNKGVKWLNHYSQLRVKYELKLNDRYLRTNAISLHIGDVVRAMDTDAGIDQEIRIVSMKLPIVNPDKITAEIANVLEETWEQELESRIQQTVDQITISSQSSGTGDSATRDWVGLNFARLAGDNVFFGTNTFNGDLHINGDIYQSGELYETHVEHIYSANDLINVRDGAATALAVGEYAGLKMLLADGTNNLMIVGDNAGVARVGWEGGTLQAIATREDSPVSDGVAMWDGTNSYFRTTKTPTVDKLTTAFLEVPDVLYAKADEFTVYHDAVFENDEVYFAGRLRSDATATIANDITAGTISIGGQFNGIGLTQNQILGVGGLSIGGVGTADVNFVNDGMTYFILKGDTNRIEVRKYMEVVKIQNIGTYVSGFSGEGWDIHMSPIGSVAEFDYLTVRKSFNVYELVVNQIRATNGSLWVSDSAKVIGVMNGGSYYKLLFDIEDGTRPIPFAVNDIVRCQVFNGSNMKYYSAIVTSTGEDYINISATNFDGDLNPETRDELVRVGNLVNTSRQGAIYLTSSDNGAPYLDVIDEVDSFSFVDKTKVRLGKLNGVTDPLFGALEGYGLWAENAYIRGKIEATEGKIGAWVLTPTELYNEVDYIDVLDNEHTAKIYMNGNGIFVYPAHTENIQKGIKIFWTAYNNWGIRCNSGNLAQLDEVFSAGSRNHIANWSFTSGAINSPDGLIKLNSASNVISVEAPFVTTPSYALYGIKMGQIASGEYGLVGYEQMNNKKFFKLSNLERFIAGWNFDDEAIWSGTKNGTGNADLTLSNTGDYIIQSKSFNVKRDGTVEVLGTIEVSNPVTDALSTLATITSSEFKIEADADNFTRMFMASADSWGLEGVFGGESVFRLGSVNRISGLSFDGDKLFTENLSIDTSNNSRITFYYDEDNETNLTGISFRAKGATEDSCIIEYVDFPSNSDWFRIDTKGSLSLDSDGAMSLKGSRINLLAEEYINVQSLAIFGANITAQYDATFQGTTLINNLEILYNSSNRKIKFGSFVSNTDGDQTITVSGLTTIVAFMYDIQGKKSRATWTSSGNVVTFNRDDAVSGEPIVAYIAIGY